MIGAAATTTAQGNNTMCGPPPTRALACGFVDEQAGAAVNQIFAFAEQSEPIS